jgi:hypothetical protein
MAADEGTVMKRTVSQRDQARPRSSGLELVASLVLPQGHGGG